VVPCDEYRDHARKYFEALNSSPFLRDGCKRALIIRSHDNSQFHKEMNVSSSYGYAILRDIHQ